MYNDGEGVSENYVLAYAWHNLAAAQSEQGAPLSRQEARDSLRLRMTNEQVARAQKVSIEIYARRVTPTSARAPGAPVDIAP